MSDDEVSRYLLPGEFWGARSEVDNRIASTVQGHYMDATLDDIAYGWAPIACACVGCFIRHCRVCSCGHMDMQRAALRRAAHIVVKQMADLLARRGSVSDAPGTHGS